MYKSTKSKVRVNNLFTDEFEVKVGVHQGSVLSPLLFIIVLEALSSEFKTGTPWELLYADDLVIVAETENDLRRKLAVWKEKLEKKGLRVNIGKTKVMICGNNLGTLTDSGNFPCGVYVEKVLEVIQSTVKVALTGYTTCCQSCTSL